MNATRMPIDLVVRSWYADHRVADRTILPAVEALLLLASEAQAACPEVEVRIMEQGRFPRFLAIAPDRSTIQVEVECTINADGGVVASLLSRVRIKSMTRVFENAQVCFPRRSKIASAPCPGHEQAPGQAHLRVSAQQIYRELVPFGPAYQSLEGDLLLGERTAQGRVRAPILAGTDPIEAHLGSPFPLDGAFHAACVLGQRTEDYVPFPVTFERRHIVRPALPGEDYGVGVILRERTTESLTFDLELTTADGLLCEAVTGLTMRDVSGGRIKPPAWIKG